ncbi:MAG: hypothetical protein H7A26_08000 [Spirochaetales bacterium]|nr:hypothetical protein [Spirochaetales bacterium]
MGIVKAVSAAILIFFSIYFVSCDSNEGYFYGKIKSNGKYEKTSLRFEKSSDRKTGYYRFKKPYIIENSGQPVFFKSDIPDVNGPLFFTIHTASPDTGADSKHSIEIFSEGPSKAELFFKIQGPLSIKGFSITELTGENGSERYPAGKITEEKKSNIPGASGPVEVRIIESTEYIEGFFRENGVIYQSENFHRISEDKEEVFTFNSGSGNGINNLDKIKIRVENGPLFSHDENTLLVNFYSRGIKKSVKALPVKDEMIFTQADLKTIFPALPDELRFSVTSLKGAAGPAVKGVSVFRRSENRTNSDYSAIKADFNSMLDYSMENWRNGNFELFSWSVFPEFLLIDTIDYRFQNAMFKRLAFFVEKPGTAGKLLTDSEMEKLHGWNAHDYRAEDLCRFFNLAEKTGFILSEEEKMLKVLLLENKIIRKDKGGREYLPAGGGILSISRESNPFLRKVFISHEGYHGVFFSSKEFREKCGLIWNKTPDDVKTFWKFFLAHKHYDISNNYLVINEFMAYNLQQTPEKGKDYFFEYIIPALYDNYPSRKVFLDNINENYREEFYKISTDIADALFETTGLPPGKLLFIENSPES